MPSKIGYARILAGGLEMDSQLQALKNAGCDEIFHDHDPPGSELERTGFDRALAILKEGDTLVVCSLDSLGSSLSALVRVTADLGAKGIAFCSLNENIDTSGANGTPVSDIMTAFADFERSLISRWTRAGMQAAKLKGTHIGRQPSLTTDQVDEAIRALEQPGGTFTSVAKSLDISPRSLKRLVAKRIQERN
jgi:DNA invertase Pin-like site-specific DNA recombinase